MNKLARRTVRYSLILLALVIAVLLVAPFFIDAGRYKSLITDRIEAATGRDVSIGDLHASLFPWIGVRLKDVRIGNRPGFDGGNAGKDFLRVRGLDVQLALLPLLRKEVEIRRFVLDAPELWLARNARGETNWQDLAGAPAAGGAPAVKTEKKGTSAPAGAGLAALSAQAIVVKDAAVHFMDATTKRRIDLDALNLRVTDLQLERPVRLDVSGHLAGGEFSAKGEAGPLGDLAKLDARRVPLQLSIHVKDWNTGALAALLPASASLPAGTLGMDMDVEQRPKGVRVFAGSLRFHGRFNGQMAGVHDLELALKGEMPSADQAKLANLVLRLDGEKALGATGVVRGIGGRLRYQARLGTPPLSRRQVAGWLPEVGRLYAAHPAPWKKLRVGAFVSGDARHVELRDIQLGLDDELVQGSGSLRWASGKGGRQSVEFRLASTSLHLDPWLPAPRKGDEGQALGGMVPAAWAEAAPATEPDLRFLKSWRVMGNAQFGHLFAHGLDMAHLRASVVGNRGVFELNPLRFDLAGGQVNEHATLDASRYPARWHESAKLRGVAVQPVLKALAGTDMLSGILQMNTDLSGTGLLPDAATRHLNGKGDVLLRDGMIKGFDIPGTLRHLTQPGLNTGPKKTDFSQLSGSFRITNGIVSNDDLFMASPLFRLTGHGTISLPAKTMDYHVRPRLVGTLVGQGDTETVRKGLVVPLRIVGPLDAPKVKVEMDMKTLIGNAGAARQLIEQGKGGKWKQLLGGQAAKPAGKASPSGTRQPGSGASGQPASPVPEKLIPKPLKGLIPGF